MAGLDDYQFYTNLKEKDSPFWQKVDTQYPEEPANISRPSSFPENLKDISVNPNPFKKTSNFDDVRDNHSQFEKYGEVSITLISVCTENLLSHPFIVLKRQCQVNVSSQRYHLTPFTLFPALFHIQSRQGLSALWKGLGSVLTVRGVTLALEDFLSKFTPWPKEISPHSSLKMIGQHLLLKCSALALITPFYSASLVETVQSEVTSERPGIFDVFKEGLYRLLSFTQPQTGRMLPVWLLIVPTVAHGILQYIIGNIVSTATTQILRSLQRKCQKRQGALLRDPSLSDASIRLQASFIGHCVADAILFPLETILHRLHLQGTRTIIDSLDGGYEVKPILTRYEGFFDCLSTTVKEEGVLGLFKGYGALCIQYAMYGTVLKFAHIIIRDVSLFLSPPVPKPISQSHVAPLTPGVAYPPVTAFHSGVSSLHSSPIHVARSREARNPHSGSVDLGDLSGMEYSSSPSPRPGASHNIDVKAEIERHKANLYQYRN
ncbi:Solute carrier family 25 member 46 [Armadillidium nasatum]|uniref:Solute carrier family 25 member 46 n=1 Tax=Armadillidium nasatum TaxID=96803 RepID=A0A5N5SK98_9CRUS|nr:Solute carrier family 25 member 46 [Armadillidium nasatum]